MREIIKRIPVVGPAITRIHRNLFFKQKPFPGSEGYWIQRYATGGNSGEGSYNRLAEFKAEIINGFVKDNRVTSIIEYGCGDGNQLKLAEYPSYVGFDISPKAIEICSDFFRNDKTKSFKMMSEYMGEKAQLTLSMDVIYHLIEDDIYNSHMERLFSSSERFVIIYSSDYDDEHIYHEKRRKFTRWVDAFALNWKLKSHIPNRFPFNGRDQTGSLSDFYIYEASRDLVNK